MKFLWLALITSITLQAAPQPRQGFDWDWLETLAIQDRGRIKPFDTFARESVLFISGKSHWKKMRSTETVFSWLVALEPEWSDEEFIRVDYAPLKKEIGLDVSRNFFKPSEVQDLPALRKLVREAGKKENDKERLGTLEKKAVELENKRQLLDSIVSGNSFVILPSPKGEVDGWQPLSAMTARGSLSYPGEAVEKFATSLKSLIGAYLKQDASAWSTQSYEVRKAIVEGLASGHYPPSRKLSLERHYNHLRPFRWSWVFYSLAFCLLVAFFVSGKSVLKKVGFSVLLGGFAFHTYGFVLRCLISDRPPVTNMYESVVWVTWGCVLFSLLIWLGYKNVIVPTAAVVFSAIGLVMADNLPLILDPGIHPLVPVLRSNYWLTIHVLTITLSYAAFAVSLCIGNVNLGLYAFAPKKVEMLHENIMYMYRAMQIGVVLLAAGTILGGIWADYSWGRFWGWDPKEVWALIALLLYVAVLHGRFTGWLKGFGFVATTVLSFLGVLMAWYGVNFVLGVGLHSYGFGSGGMGYMLTFVLVQLAFIAFAYRSYVKAGKPGNQFVVKRTGM